MKASQKFARSHANRLKSFLHYGRQPQCEHTGGALLGSLLDAKHFLADRGYYADRFRYALEIKGIDTCIPRRKSRQIPVKYDKHRAPRRIRIEMMYGDLKDWRRVATRCDTCPKVFLNAITLTAEIMLWLWVQSLG